MLHIFRLLLIVTILQPTLFHTTKAAETNQEETLLSPTDLPIKKTTRQKREISVKIDKEENLHSLLEKIARIEKLNIIFPIGNDQVNQKINFGKKQRLPISTLKRYVETLLRLSGYALSSSPSALLIQKVNEINITRRTLPLFVNIAPEKLPNEDSDIRAIYFLSNFKIPPSADSNEPINLLIRDTLGVQSSYFYDPKTNSIILTGSSRNIAATMNLVLKLDETGSPEKIEEVRVVNAPAKLFAQIINEQLIAATRDVHSIRPTIKTHEDLYFAPNTRVFANKERNSLIIIGQESSIRRIKKLVQEHLDRQPDSGNSILHVYELQYLDAKDFAPTLSLIVKSNQTQSKKDTSGPAQSFDEVIVVGEETQAQGSGGGRSAKLKSGLTIGGNRLIIACLNKDWPYIKALIEQLDKPQLQIAVQVLIADLTFIGRKEIKAHMRNPLDLAQNHLLPNNFSFQSAQLSSVLTGPATPSSSLLTLATDLLKLTASDRSDMAIAETTGSTNYGSMIISFADKTNNSIWGVLKLLDRWIDSKIVTQIIITVKNNEETTSSNTVIKRKEGTSDGRTINTTIPIKDFEATTSVTIKPRISSIDRLSLQISAQVEAFTDKFNRKTQNIETSASINSGDILVLGGLAKINDSESNTQWPLLGSIPIIGNLFKGNSQSREKSNLAIFIHPTIIDPKLRSGFNQLTNELIEEGKNIIKSGELFSSIKDPVTMLYFSNEQHVSGSALFKDFQEQGEQITQKPSQKAIAQAYEQWEKEGLRKLGELSENPFAKK